jgi:hypothetical protein
MRLRLSRVNSSIRMGCLSWTSNAPPSWYKRPGNGRTIHTPMTLGQRLTTHAIVGVVVDDEGIGLRHCPAFIEDTAAVKGGEIARYETAN